VPRPAVTHVEMRMVPSNTNHGRGGLDRADVVTQFRRQLGSAVIHSVVVVEPFPGCGQRDDSRQVFTLICRRRGVSEGSQGFE